MLQFC